MSQDDPGGAYRGEEDAARARVEALERELSSARQNLAALQPREEPVGPQVLGGLRLLLCGKAIDLVLVALSMVVVRLLPSSAFGAGFALIELGFVGATVLAILGLLRLQPVSATLGGGLIAVALVGEGLCGLLGVLGLLQHVLGAFGHLGIGLAFAWRAAILLGGVPLLLLYYRLGCRLARPAIAPLAVTTIALFLALQALSIVTTLARELSWLQQVRGWFSLAVSVLIVTLAGLALAAARTGQLALGTFAAEQAGERARAAAGLRMHRAGVLVKVAGSLLGVLLLVAAHGARSPEAGRAVLVLLLVVGLTGATIAFVGLIRYTRVPEASGGRGLAIAAALLSGGGLVVDLCAALVIGVAISDGRGDLARTGGLLEPIGLALSLPALILLLLSLRRVAAHLASLELATRALQLAILVGIVAPIAVLLKIPSLARELGLAVFALGVPALFLGIYLLVRYLGLLGRVAEALEE